MAGDWIKMRGNLWDDPRVARLVEATDSTEAAVIGGLYWLWATADQHTETGHMPGLTIRGIDRKTGVQGLGEALRDLGWIEAADDGILIVRFEEHNGESAKRRASDAKRKADVRKSADKSRTDDGQISELLREIAELEKEIEIEKKRKTEIPARKRAAPAALVSVSDMVAEGVDQQNASDWLTARKAKDLPLTPTAWQQTKDEAGKAGLSISDAIKVAAGNGWAGFKASWMAGDSRGPPRGIQPVTVPSAEAEKTAEYLKAQQMSPEERAAAAEARRRVMAGIKVVA